MGRLSLPFLFVLSLFALTGAGPIAKERCFIADSTNDLAAALIQASKGSPDNVAYSPLGVNTLLAIFAEGAGSDTYEELSKALHLPSDRQETRLAYQKVLKAYSEHYERSKPEMRNEFYIYKNNTIREELKDTLKEFYYVKVKSVDRPEDAFTSEEDSKKTPIPAGLQGKPVDHLIDVDKEVEAIIESASSPHKSDGEEAASSQQPALFDPSKKDEVKEPVPEKNDEVRGLPGSANSFEKTQLSEEQRTQLKKDEKVKEEESVTVPNKVEAVNNEKENEVEKDVQKEKKEEVMVAMQRSIDADNNMNALTDGGVKVVGKDSTPRMIVFNGFYFFGGYENKFVKVKADESRPFYKENNEQAIVNTLHAEGPFQTAEIEDLKSRAVEVRYEGGKYSLLLLLPNEQNGASQLVEKLPEYPISKIQSQLTEKVLDICLPTFQATSISKTLSTLKESKVITLNKVFDSKAADFSGINDDSGLFLDDLVQVVTFKVDVNDTEANFLTASFASSRSDVEQVKFNHPFIYYLLDNEHGIVIVNGKVVDPTPVSEDSDFNASTLRNTMRTLLL